MFQGRAAFDSPAFERALDIQARGYHASSANTRRPFLLLMEMVSMCLDIVEIFSFQEVEMQSCSAMGRSRKSIASSSRS